MVRAIDLRASALLLAASWSWPRAEGACYFPSGRAATNDIPCRDDTPEAACCGQGYACLSNGICQATGEELKKADASEFVRGSCTDKEWRSSSCPLFCIEDGVDFLDGGNGIAKCANTTEDLYFCVNSRSATEASCEEKKKVLFFPGTPSAITTIGVAPSTTASSSTSTSSSTTIQSSPASTGLPTAVFPTVLPGDGGSSNRTGSAGSSSNVGAIVGGVVGGVAAIVIAGVVGWLLARKRINKGDDGNSVDDAAAAAMAGHPLQGEPKSPLEAVQPYSDAPHEAHGAWKPHAQQQQRGPYELAPALSRQELPTQLPPELPAGHGNDVGRFGWRDPQMYTR